MVSVRSFLSYILPVFFFTGLTALAAHAKIYLPFTPVPITLQSLAIVLAGASLGWKRGALSQLLLISFGMIGLPVFTATQSGIDVVLGATGGYILGFILCAAVAGMMKEKGVLSSPVKSFGWLFLASLFIFLPGVIWLKTLTGMNWMDALEKGFFPFMIGDVVKTALATGVVFASAKIKRP